MKYQKGFISIPIIIILIGLGIAGGFAGYKYYQYQASLNQKNINQPKHTKVITPTVTSTPKPNITPTPTVSTKNPQKITTTTQSSLIDCVGPDGKHVSLTQAQCDSFLSAWATPTPSPTPTPAPQSTTCDTSTNLGNLTVSIQPASGQTIVGDAGVTMSNGTGSCAGNDSRLPYEQVIKQGSTSVTFSGYRPGIFHIKVDYHTNIYNEDVYIHSGSNSTTITVSN